MTNIESIPRALAERPIWLAYKLEDRGNGRLSKPPVSPRTGRVCAKTDETEQVTLTDALVGMERYDAAGVGVVLPDGIVCIDLDSAFEDAGELRSVAQNVYDHFSGTVWEYSPSGNGLHGYMFGIKTNNRTKDAALGIEVYGKPAFLTVTGDLVEGSVPDLTNQQDALDWLFETYLPPLISANAEVRPVEHGERTPQEWLTLGLARDEKLLTVYNNTNHGGDESSTDFSLMSKLAYWLNRDTDAMTEAFMASPWAHTKDVAHSKKLERSDYLPDSIVKAAAMCSTTAFETSKLYETKAVRFFSQAGSDDIADFPLKDYTDLGNAASLAQVFGDGLCYTPQWGWCFFNGSRWETDVSYRAMNAARDIAQALTEAAKALLDSATAQLDADGLAPGSDDGKRLLKPARALYDHAMKSQSEHGITAMVALNKAYMIASADNFNIDPWFLNTPSGVVDLKTGELMPHDAKYRLTSMTSVAPAKIATPMFNAFLDKIFCNDAELIDFVQKSLGSALVGKVYTENLIIANGCGSNGKSTLFNTMHYLLGDYATGIDPNLLLSTKANEQQVGMAMLEGKRFAVAQETEEGQRLSSSMLKRMVSTDTMVAKKLYKDPHEFPPSHTLVLSTNHLPKISSTDTGTWRRIVVLPFEATIRPEEIITDFHSLLMEREGGGILQWAIDGAVKFYEMGCDIPVKPAAVVRVSAEYRVDEDWVAGFLGECCTPGDPHNESVMVKHNDLYRVYQHWAKTRGEYVRSTNALSRALQTAGWKGKQKFYDAPTGATVKIWFGFSLLDGGRFQLTQGSAA